MKRRLTPRRLVYSSLLGVILVGGSSVAFVNCTPTDHANSPSADCHEQHEQHEHHEHHEHHHRPAGDLGTAPNVIYCSGISDCEVSAYYPTCADPDTITCVAPNSPPSAPKECVFRVSQDTGCFCLERDIRACSIGSGGSGGGTQGIQHCVATGGWTTGWGGCGGC